MAPRGRRRQRPGGRRRAAEPGSRTSGGTGWSTRSDSDNWAGHTDTGSMEILDDPGATNSPSWGSRSEAPSRRADRDEPSADWRTRSDSWRAEPVSGSWRAEPAPPWRAEPDSAAGARADSGPAGRTRPGSWSRGEEPRRRRSAGERQQIGWQPAADDRDATSATRPGRRQLGWQPERGRAAAATATTTATCHAAGRSAGSRPQTSGTTQPARRPGGRRAAEPDTPSWQRSAPAAIGWRSDADERDDADGPSWRQDPRWQDERSATGRRSWRDTGARRRGAEPADPWAQNAADTGIIPLTGQPPATDTGSWRSGAGAVGRARPMNPNSPPRRDRRHELPAGRGAAARTRPAPGAGGGGADPDEDMRPASAAPISPEVWRREPGSRTDGANWPEDEPQDDWRDRRPEAPQDDWRRGLEPGSGVPVGDVGHRDPPARPRRVAARGARGGDGAARATGVRTPATGAGRWPPRPARTWPTASHAGSAPRISCRSGRSGPRPYRRRSRRRRQPGRSGRPARRAAGRQWRRGP